MAANVDRFRRDLERLIETGDRLDLAMVHEVDSAGFMKQATTQIGNTERAKAFVKTLPNFKTAYEAWYTESIALL
jgi:hypothetical protein